MPGLAVEDHAATDEPSRPVIPYYERFVSRFPTIRPLPAAPSTKSDPLGWAWLLRAGPEPACLAQKAVAVLGGFPADTAGLRALPGIGAYTAAAVAAIGFGIPAVPVDGNVERVTARLFALTDPLPGAKGTLALAAASLGRDPDAMARPSDFAQGLFDLGASVCTPTSPGCVVCPWMERCQAQEAGDRGGTTSEDAEEGTAFADLACISGSWMVPVRS